MDVTGLLVSLLLGLPTPALAVLKDFHLVNQLKNWTEAQSYCREKFDDLVTIESADDWTRIRQMVANSGQPEAWMGLYDEVKSWRWSLDNKSLYERDLGSWFDFEDDNQGSSQHCVLMYLHRLIDDPCSLVRESFCYDETTDSLILVTAGKTWQEALTYCRQTYTDLASITNQQEWNDIVATTAYGSAIWFGLSRESWKWSDQSECSLRMWAPNEPHGYGAACGSAAVDGWKDLSCQLEIPFICSAPPRRVLKIMLKIDGSVNLNDLLVQETVLKQMEEDVRGQGVQKQFTLSWRREPHGDIFNQLQPSDAAASAISCL